MTDVALQHYLERLITEQERLMRSEIAGLRGELRERLDGADRALELNAREMSRRLDALNGEAGRLAVVLSQSVPREVWEESTRSQQAVNEGVASVLATLTGRERGVSQAWGVLVGAIGVLAAVVALWRG